MELDILLLNYFVAKNVKRSDIAVQYAKVKITHDISKNVLDLLQLERKRSEHDVRRESNRSKRRNRLRMMIHRNKKKMIHPTFLQQWRRKGTW